MFSLVEHKSFFIVLEISELCLHFMNYFQIHSIFEISVFCKEKLEIY